MSWRALGGPSDACASAFHALGVRRGDRVPPRSSPTVRSFPPPSSPLVSFGAHPALLRTDHTCRARLRFRLLEKRGGDKFVRLNCFLLVGLKTGAAANAGQRQWSPRSIKRAPFRRRCGVVLFTLLREKHDGDCVSIAPGPLTTWLTCC